MSERIRTIRRKKGEKKPENTAPEVAQTSPESSDTKPAPAPKKVQKPRGPRIDAAALAAEASALDADDMASLMSGSVPTDPEPGQQVTGTVASITDSVVFVNIGAKSEGSIDKDALSDADALKVGDTLSAFVLSVGVRGIKLAEKLSGSGSREMLEEAYRGKIPVEGIIDSRNPGGFNVQVSAD